MSVSGAPAPSAPLLQFIPFVDALAILNAVRLLRDGLAEQNARVGEKTQDRCGRCDCSKAAKPCLLAPNSPPSSFREVVVAMTSLDDAGKHACLIVASLIIGIDSELGLASLALAYDCPTMDSAISQRTF